MRNWIVGAFAIVVLVVGLSFPVAVPAAPPAPVPHPGAAAAPSPEPHPEIREAIGALRRAKAHLEHAAHDFGGHRVDAVRATDEAIRQLQICLQYDKN
jgi:hypothetical protein